MRCSPALSTALVALFGLSPALALPHQQQQQPDCDTPDASNVINRDVVVIGAGSSGTHAALAIKDAGKSVIVVENQAQAGGHTHTYTDKATGATVDYGVLVFHNTSTVHEYFGRYKIPLTPVSFAAPREVNFDFSTGKPIQLAQSNPQALQLAFQKYAGFLSKYTQLAGGLFLPNPVPQELLMPFGQLVKQLGLEAMVPIVNQFNPGQGDVLSVPVVENARVMSLQLIQQIAANGLLTTVRNNNSELYAAATAELQASNSILLSSSVIKSKRTQNGVELVVKTPKGVKHIRAKRLLMAIPPHLDNLKPFSPTQAERSVFSKLVNSGYYTALVKNTGIPLGLQISNRGANTPYNSPQLPGSYIYRPTRIPGVNSVMFGTDLSSAMFPLDEQTIQGRVVAELKRLQTANQQLNFTMAEPEFVIAKYHSPFYQSFSAESIKAGAYGQMYALQGQFSTFWTGAAWRAEDSSALWDFNKQVVLPMLLKSL